MTLRTTSKMPGTLFWIYISERTQTLQRMLHCIPNLAELKVGKREEYRNDLGKLRPVCVRERRFTAHFCAESSAALGSKSPRSCLYRPASSLWPLRNLPIGSSVWSYVCNGLVR